MKIEDFFNKYNGKGIDNDGAYGFQCMDLYNQYQEEVMGVKAKGANYAYLVWDSYDKENFDRIVNTPSFVPKLGDVAVWTKGKIPYGHVSICTGKGDINKFESFDQNWNKPYCTYEEHDYFNGFLGVLRPKKFINDTLEYAKGLYVTLEVMNVRDGIWGRKKQKSELTEDGKKNALDNGSYKKGTVFTAIDIITHTDGSVWVKGYSGYVCIKDKIQVYCKKV